MLGFGEKVGNRDIERLGNDLQHANCRIADPAFYSAKISPMFTRALRQFFQCPATFIPQIADSLPDPMPDVHGLPV